MNQVFVKLFEVRIWHDYLFLEDVIPGQIPFSYEIKDLVSIIPSSRTKAVFRSYNLIFKPTQVGFMVVARIEEGAVNQTFSRFDERVQLTFFIQIKHPHFSTFTSLPLERLSKELYCFDNLTANSITVGARSLHYISDPIPAFDPARTYNMGDLVREQDKVFEVVDIPVPADAVPVPGVQQSTWEEAKNTQYASDLDLLPHKIGVFRFSGPNLNPGEEALFEVRNQFGEAIDLGFQNIPGETIPAGKAIYPEDPQTELRHSLFLNGKKEGRYSVSLDDAPVGDFYLLPPREVGVPLGVIELFHTPPTEDPAIPQVPAGFGFVDIGPEPDNPLSIPTGIVYNLHFKSRLTFRRYISGDQVDLHDQALPLSRAVKGVEVNGKKMPEPGVMSIEKEVDQVGDRIRERYFSNIYV